jgi:hypothetical protein
MVTTAKQSEILDKVEGFRRHYEDSAPNRLQRMRKCRRFRRGDQWDSDVEEYNKLKRRQSLTLNKVQPIVNQLIGTICQNRKDPRIRPKKGATVTAANILTALAKDTYDQASIARVQVRWFDDGVTTGAGYVVLEKDMANDPRTGELTIRKKSPFNVRFELGIPEYDPNVSGQWVQYDDWVSKSKLEKEYPKKKPQLTDVMYDKGSTSSIYSRVIDWLFRDTADAYRDDDDDREDGMAIGKYRYRVTTTYWKEYRDHVWVYPKSDPTNPYISNDPEQVRAGRELAKTEPDWVFIKPKPVLIRAITCGDVLLAYDEDPFNGMTLFPVIPYYAYFEDGYMYGVVKNLIGPQEEYNWLRSQFLNVIKKIANIGWIGKNLGPVFKRFLKSHQHEDGVLLEVPAGGALEKITPNEVPAGYAILAERSAQDMQENANVRLEQPTFDEKHMSGYAISLKQQSSLTGSQLLFLNFDQSMALLTRVAVEMILRNRIYNPAEIEAIVDEADLIDHRLIEEAAEVAQEQYGITMPEPPADPTRYMAEGAENPALIPAIADDIQAEMEVYARAKKSYDALIAEISHGRD